MKDCNSKCSKVASPALISNILCVVLSVFLVLDCRFECLDGVENEACHSLQPDAEQHAVENGQTNLDDWLCIGRESYLRLPDITDHVLGRLTRRRAKPRRVVHRPHRYLGWHRGI